MACRVDGAKCDTPGCKSAANTLVVYPGLPWYKVCGACLAVEEEGARDDGVSLCTEPLTPTSQLAEALRLVRHYGLGAPAVR